MKLQETLFKDIPLWLGIKSLQGITGLSQCPHLQGHVKHIVVSAVRFVEHQDEDAYLAKMKDQLELMIDFSSCSALRIGQHRAAYRAALEAQRYLTTDSLDLKILTRAFRRFPNLVKITYDPFNIVIGAREIIQNFGWLDAEHLLTCDDPHTLSTLLRALVESKVTISDFRFGFEEVFSSQNFAFGVSEHSCLDLPASRPKQITPRTINSAFSSPETQHSARIATKGIRTLEFSDIEAETSGEDVWILPSVIKDIIKRIDNLESIDIGEIPSRALYGTISLEDLLDIDSSYSLKHLKLAWLYVVDYLEVVDFVHRHAETLTTVGLRSVELTNGTYVTRFPASHSPGQGGPLIRTMIDGQVFSTT